MNHSPSISVLIPTYNRAELIHCSIESVLAQSSSPNEILVVNDGSTDKTLEVLQHYSHQITILNQKNSGQSLARNNGILHAKSDWIAFLDDDDEFHPHRIAQLRESILAHPNADIHATNLAIISESGTVTNLWEQRGKPSRILHPEKCPLRWALDGCFFLQGMAIRKEALHSIGLFREIFSVFEDLDLFVRLASRRPWVLDSRITASIIRRSATDVNASSLWRSQPAKKFQALATIYRDALTSQTWTPAERQWLQQSLGANLFDLGLSLHVDREPEARAAIRQSLSHFVSIKSRIKAHACLLFPAAINHLLERRSRQKPSFIRL